MKKYNFNAGPCILDRSVIEKTAQAILDFNGIGLSLAEISHRSKDFQPVIDEAEALVKELLQVPEGYSVLFLVSRETVGLSNLNLSIAISDDLFLLSYVCYSSFADDRT